MFNRYKVPILLLVTSIWLQAEPLNEQTTNQDKPFVPYSNWQDHIKVDEEAYVKHMLAEVQAMEKEESNRVNSWQLPGWLVAASLKNMPRLLRGIFNYLKMHNEKNVIPSCHRFILVGKPGTGKTTLAQAIAHSLGYEELLVHASTLFGKYRNQTAVRLREVFDSVKGDQSPKVIIIDELHKLFENYAYKRADDSANATAFWNQLDQFERDNHNIIVIGTANSVEKLPPEIKSRFHGKIIEMPLPNVHQRERALKQALMHDTAVRRTQSVNSAFLNQLSKRLKKFSLRDVQLLIDTAKMFRYAELKTKRNVLIRLQKRHFEQALQKLESENKTNIYKMIRPYIKKIGEDVHVIAQIGFIVSLVGAGLGRVGLIKKLNVLDLKNKLFKKQSKQFP